MMEHIRKTATFACAVAFAAFCTTASAQTCPAPMAVQWDGNIALSASTCDHEPAGLLLCGGAVLTNGPSFVARVPVGEGATAVLSLDGSGSMQAIMLLVGAGCDSGPCLFGDASTPLSLAGVAPGDYDLVVTADPATSPAGTCSAFVLSYTGDFGVFDRIFADGFD